MWFKHYRDYPHDAPIIKEQVGPSHGIIGCEMHDSYGWGTSYHRPRKKERKGFMAKCLSWLLKKRKNHG